MQHTRPHNRRDFHRQQSPRRPSVDGFVPRRPQQMQYERRSTEILPATDTEYMISLGSRASRRDDVQQEQSQQGLQKIAVFGEKLYARIKTKQPRRLRPSLPVMGVGVFLLVAIIGLTAARSHNPVTADQDLQRILQDNGDTPHDKAPYNHGGYSVAPDLPKLLTIRKLGINARVTRLSARENSEPKSPQNIYDVGWYENSAKPAEEGATLLIGHINGSEKEGVFHDLTNLVPGDEFQLELGDGTIKNFYVVKMKAYDRNNVDFAALMQSAVVGQPGLNLLTAVGSFESNAEVIQQLGVFAVEK